MKVKYTGQNNPLSLLHGKEYPVKSTECGWYRIVDESGEDYLYPPELLEITEEFPQASRNAADSNAARYDVAQIAYGRFSFVDASA